MSLFMTLVPQVYPYGRLEASADAGAVIDRHDIRGTPALLRALAQRPGASVSLDTSAPLKAP